MSNDNKTLADVQPGGRVRLGDALRPCPFCGHSDFDQWPCEYIDASGANVVRCARCHAAAPMKVWHALSAQPSPGGQGDAPEIEQIRTLVSSILSTVSLGHQKGPYAYAGEDFGRYLAEATRDCRAILRALSDLAARQPVGEPFGWLIARADVSPFFVPASHPEIVECFRTELAAEVGTTVTEVFTTPQPPAQAVDLANVIDHIAQQWDGCSYDAVGETIDVGQVIRAAGKRLALIDSQEAGNG